LSHAGSAPCAKALAHLTAKSACDDAPPQPGGRMSPFVCCFVFVDAGEVLAS
jgi:hypothetical protein